jgi:integrase
LPLAVVCWVGICGPVRSNQACSIPVNTLIFDHKLGSHEERIGRFSYFNKLPVRHTCATLLLSKGVHAKFVQELLGHATIAVTLDTYSHVLPGMGNQAANAMEDALS